MGSPRLGYVVAGFLGVTLVLCVLLAGLLALNGQPIPDLIGQVAIGALGAIAGILAPGIRSSSSSS